ncbi:sensor histidine kinase [Aneurinibacillus terranovensis]|uniref:sensor histidine kinase n=1 Tax=Aneurinibacillus terranovensis TaxID=278991 RepID=UPI0004230B2F|nr:ATP-binding protein [Aneurinibacillus terranovensis]
MFKKTRNRLTILFTGLMILFLLSFILTSYFLLSFMIYEDSRANVRGLVAEEFNDHAKDIINAGNYHKGISAGRNHDHDDEVKASIYYKKYRYFFYYVVDANGKVIKGDEGLPQLRGSIVKEVQGWRPKQDEISLKTFTVDGNPMYIMMAGRSLYAGNRYQGGVYVGVDVTEQHQALKRTVTILTMVAVAFLFISSLLGLYMSDRAMQPIMRSFTRQREFVDNASHELRTPLTILQSSLEVLETEEKGKASEFSLQVMDDMKDELKWMTRLVGYLLTLARADSGVIELAYESFDAAAVAQQTARSFETLLAKRKQHFAYEAPDELIVYADRERVIQLLYILLDNASKYTPEGGSVTLRVSEQGKEKNRKVRIDVIDTGVGISLENKARIFDRFYRVDKGRSREMGGTGLGLSIASWIVKAHKGSIQLDSMLGKGSVFTVLLPIKET